MRARDTPIIYAQEESAVDVVRGLLNQQKVNVGSISEYCTMWTDIRIFAREAGQSEAVRRTIRNVGYELDYLAFTQRHDQISEGHKTFILEDIPVLLRQFKHTDRVVLSYEESKLLQLAATAVNIAYDPGESKDTPENIKKRTFVFADLEDMAPSTATVVVFCSGLCSLRLHSPLHRNERAAAGGEESGT